MEYWEDYEVLRVETPELLELRLPLAGFGPRFLAAAVDYLLIGLAYVIFAIAGIAVASTSSLFSSSSAPSTIFIIIVAAFLVLMLLLPFIYYCYFEYAWNGQSPGKRVAGIRVVKRGGVPLSFRDVLIRNLLRMVDWLPSSGFIALVSFFATKHQQRLGDLAADTVVVREFRSKVPLTFAGGEAPSQMYAPGTLTPQLSYVIQSYLSRSSRFDTPLRLQICQAVISKLGYDPGALSLSEQEHYLASILRGSMAQFA